MSTSGTTAVTKGIRTLRPSAVQEVIARTVDDVGHVADDTPVGQPGLQADELAVPPEFVRGFPGVRRRPGVVGIDDEPDPTQGLRGRPVADAVEAHQQPARMLPHSGDHERGARRGVSRGVACQDPTHCEAPVRDVGTRCDDHLAPDAVGAHDDPDEQVLSPVRRPTLASAVSGHRKSHQRGRRGCCARRSLRRRYAGHEPCGRRDR